MSLWLEGQASENESCGQTLAGTPLDTRWR